MADMTINDSIVDELVQDELALVRLLQDDPEFIAAAKLIAAQHLPNWCIFSSFVRNKVWDLAHHNQVPTPAADIDVCFYAPGQKDLAMEVQQLLSMADPSHVWEVTNAAYTHTENDDEPYSSLVDALSKQLDTTLSVGATLDDAAHVTLIHPHGLEDLMQCIIRPTPIIYAHPARRQLLINRLYEKKMLEKWPRLRVII